QVARCGSVAVDEAKRRVYWTDMALNTVESVTWEGVKHRVVQKTQVISPKGLTILKDWVMWINPGTQELVRCHKYNGSQWDRKPLNDAGLALTTVTPLHFS
ncbi:vitellogenin receptor-like 1, partial [Homarus americanus]